MNLLFTLLAIFWITIAFLYAYYEGSKRKPGFIGCLLIMLIFTPFFGYFIIESFSQKMLRVAIGVVIKRTRQNIVGFAKRMKLEKLGLSKSSIAIIKNTNFTVVNPNYNFHTIC